MTTRKRVAARRPRTPASGRKHKRVIRRKCASDAASCLPHHPHYTAALLAQIRQRYEETPEPIPSMAADLGVAPGNLHRIARRHDWVKRHPAPPPRDASPVQRILQEAAALEADAAEAGVAVTGERERAGLAACTARELSIIERLQRAVLAELATIEAMRAAMGTLPQKPPGAARTVRTLSMLTQTLQHLQRLRASAVLAAQPPAATHSERDHDDMPADIDEFRNELARRIDAFVASRTESCDADRDAGVAPVDASR